MRKSRPRLTCFPAKIRIGLIAGVLISALVLPAVAHASRELAMSQTPSTGVVSAGGLVTITVTVRNTGTEAIADGEAYADMFSLSGHGQPANNPYESVSSSGGTCTDKSGGGYQAQICSLGTIASGASAQVRAVIRVNQSMNHLVQLFASPYTVGGNDDLFQDANGANNSGAVKVTASVPPTLSGSKKIKLSGLPAGCAPGDFTLNAVAHATGVKKMRVSLDLGFDDNGVGHTWQKIVRGNRIKAKVPVSRLAADLGVFYKLKVKAKRGAAGPLERTITFQPC